MIIYNISKTEPKIINDNSYRCDNNSFLQSFIEILGFYYINQYIF